MSHRLFETRHKAAPLARGDFAQFGCLGKWRSQPETIKKTVFVQIALGVMALHNRGWIHRDIKPANLGIVNLGDRPRAIIMDLGQAVRQSAKGHQPRLSHCGTIGFLAPELENSNYARSYGKEVDIWSLGAVAVYHLLYGRIPWSCEYKMFVPESERYGRTLEVFREIRTGLIKKSSDSLEWLIGSMLTEDPRHRPTLPQILSHVSLRTVRETIDRQLTEETQP